jgi:hypothetical protein
MRLTVSIATRGRPDILMDTLNAYVGNSTLPDTRVHVAIDEDDETMKGFKVRMLGYGKVVLSVQPREDTRGLKHQRVLTEAPADLYLVGTDHSPIVTPGWDGMFLEAAKLFHDGIGVVCTPLANLSFPYLQAVTAKWVELCGYVQPPQFPFWFIDHWLDDVARMTGRYVPVRVHAHSNRRTSTTTEMRDLTFWADYYNFLTPIRVAEADRIISALDDTEEHKNILRAAIPIVTQRSFMINDDVIRNADRIMASRGDRTPPGPGYIRAKRRAEAHMETLRDAA